MFARFDSGQQAQEIICFADLLPTRSLVREESCKRGCIIRGNMVIKYHVTYVTQCGVKLEYTLASAVQS